MKTIKLNKSHFESFKKQCKKWLEYFGLRDWDVTVIHEELEEGTQATVKCNMLQQTATIFMALKIEEDDQTVLSEWLDSTAFHEVCHIYINRLLHTPINTAVPDNSAMKDRLWEDMDTAHHAIINLMWALYNEK
jgi:hypothetical protein